MKNFDIDSVVEGYLNSSPVRQATPTQPQRFVEHSHITESTVRRKVSGARGSVTLTEAEARLLRNLLEQLDSDPFSGEAFITPDDLKRLGLKTVDVGAGVTDDDEDEDGGESEASTLSHTIEPMDKFPVTVALCAPDNTIGSSEPIPPEVLATLDVLKSSGEEREYKPVQQSAPQPQHQQQQPPPQQGEPVKDAFKQGTDQSDQTNDILQTFESKKPDYMALAQAALLGETALEGGVDNLTEDGNMSATGAINMVKQFRAIKKAEQGPPAAPKRYSAPAKLEGVSESLAAAYASKLGALGGGSD